MKTFLTSVMGLLTVLVFGLAAALRNVFWMWIGFVCALISGVFIQIAYDRRKDEEDAEDPQ